MSEEIIGLFPLKIATRHLICLTEAFGVCERELTSFQPVVGTVEVSLTRFREGCHTFLIYRPHAPFLHATIRWQYGTKAT